MKIGIIGAGAVGGYFGGLLAAAGEDVTFLVRKERYDQLGLDGFVVQSIHGDFTVQPNLVTSGQDLAGVDVIFLAVKNYHLEHLMDDLRLAMSGGAHLLPLLNGVFHMESLVRKFGATRVLGGSCYIETTLNGQGHIIQTSDVRDIVYGALEQDKDEELENRLGHLANAFSSAGIPAFRREPILREMWKKYIFLCAFSGTTAAARSQIGVVRANACTLGLFRQLVGELIAVAKAKGIALPEKMADSMVERIMSLDAMMTSSMHRDLEKGLPMELDSLQGALIEMARAVNIPAPAHEFVYAVLSPHRQGRR